MCTGLFAGLKKGKKEDDLHSSAHASSAHAGTIICPSGPCLDSGRRALRRHAQGSAMAPRESLLLSPYPRSVMKETTASWLHPIQNVSRKSDGLLSD